MYIKKIFKQFVLGYISAGHTATVEAEKELKRLIDECVDSIYNINNDNCFTFHAMYDVLDYVKHNLSDENEGFYISSCEMNNYKYNRLLENWIKHLATIIDSSISIRGLNFDDSDSSDSDTV